jgi:hypothetical protein
MFSFNTPACHTEPYELGPKHESAHPSQRTTGFPIHHPCASQAFSAVKAIGDEARRGHSPAAPSSHEDARGNAVIVDTVHSIDPTSKKDVVESLFNVGTPATACSLTSCRPQYNISQDVKEKDIGCQGKHHSNGTNKVNLLKRGMLVYILA